MTEDITHFGCRTERNQVRTDLETYPLTSFHSAGRCYVGYWERKVIIGLIHCWTLHDKMLTCQARCAHCHNSGVNVTR